jgi:hypothetical protein
MLRPGSCFRLAGGSPVRVGVGAPGSRPRSLGEILAAERGVEGLFGGSKRAGRSVKRTLQPRQIHNGSAEPLMSRRRPCLSCWIPNGARGLLGVRTMARVHSLEWNRRDPSCRPSSGKDLSYKPVVKSAGGERKSDGVVVPPISVQHNALGGKGPDFGHAGGAGTRKGMAARCCGPITPRHVGVV